MTHDAVFESPISVEPAPNNFALAKLPLNDLGMAKRLIARFGDRIRKLTVGGWAAYCTEAGYWLTGAKGEAMVRKYAHEAAERIWDEIAAVEQMIEASKKDASTPAVWQGLPAALRKALAKASDASGTNAMLTQAAPYVQAEPREFDRDPHLICMRNGTLHPTPIKEPCFVAYDATGAVADYVEAATVRADDLGVMLAGWRLRHLGDDIFEVAAPGSVVTDAIELDDLKTPMGEPARFERNGSRLAHRLYHLDVKLLPHQPSHLITRQAPVVYDPAAKCPKFREHLEKCLPNKQDRDFFHRFIGFGLVGSNAPQCFLFMQGKGGDGKSTTMEVIIRIGGTYHHTANPQTFMEQKNRSAADASPDMADMAGDTRMVYCEEPQKGSRLNEALLKQITGGPDLRNRQLHRDLFDWKPRFGLVMTFNDLLRLAGGDKGFWRRVRFIFWPHEFTEEERLENKVDELLTEAPGIFNYMLDGVGDFHQFGLKPHQAMKDWIENWRTTTDPFIEWLNSRCEIRVGKKEPTSALYRDYKEWIEHESSDGRAVMGERAFQNRLSSQQILPIKGDHGQRCRANIMLLPPEDWMNDRQVRNQDPRDAEE